MPDHDTAKALVAGIEALIVTVLSAPTLVYLVTRSRVFKVRYQTISGFYEDDDGEATETSMLEYNDWPSRVAAWLSSTLGLAAAITAAITSQSTNEMDGTDTGAAVLVFLTRWADVIAWVRFSETLFFFSFPNMLTNF